MDDVKKILSESELIDSLFYNCDVLQSGRVHVSSLICCLEKITNAAVQHREALRQLSKLLDPEGEDCTVDVETYRQGMQTWIEQLRAQNSELVEHKSFDAAISDRFEIASCKPHFRAHVRSPGFASRLSPQDDKALRFQSEQMETDRELRELRRANRRLCQENEQLHGQLELQEESLLGFAQEKDNLLGKMRRLQESIELQTEILAENEELKLSFSRLQEQKSSAERRISQLEKQNVCFSLHISDLETKLNKYTVDAEKCAVTMKDLQTSVLERKISLQEAEERLKKQDVEIAEKDQLLLEVKSRLSKMTKINEDLRRNNAEIQLQLPLTQQKFVRRGNNPHQKNPVASSLGGSESDNEDSDDAWKDDGGGNLRSCRRFAGTGPRNVDSKASIHTEIRNMLTEKDDGPSPLSDKERKEDIGRGESKAWAETESPCLDDLLGQNTQFNSLKSFIQALVVDINTSGDKEDTLCTSELSADEGRQQNIDLRFCQFLVQVQELHDENKRLRRLHDSTVNSILDLTGDSCTSVTASDTRIMVLREILQEERARTTKLQEQVMTLKTILGVVDKRNSLDFQTVKETLCQQQDKIEHLKSSNLELAEKYHKAELTITDLQEEALEASQNLEKEKHRCSKLEDAVRSSDLAKRLDLIEIWRLLLKDGDMGCAEIQDDSNILSSADKIKQKIILQIKSNQLFQKNGGGDTKLPERVSKDENLQGKVSGHYYCPRRKCCIAVSPLLDALALDLLQGNYYQKPSHKTSLRPGTPSTRHILATGPYFNCSRMSCEDPEGLESRVSHLGFDFPENKASLPALDCPENRLPQPGFDCLQIRAPQPGSDCPGIGACSSLPLRLGQGDPGDLGGCDGVASPRATDYNCNCRPSLPWSGCTTSRHQREEGRGMVSAAGGPGGVSSPAGCAEAGVVEDTAAPRDSSVSGTSAQHRRRDFHKTSHSRWTATTNTTTTTTSDTGLLFSLNDGSLDCSQEPTPQFSHLAAPATVSEGSCSESSMAVPGQCSPAGFRRMSFLAAVDKCKGKDVDWSRRPSYRAAIDPRYLAGEMPLAVPHCSSEPTDGGVPAQISENRTVTFQLGDEDIRRSLRAGGDTAAANKAGSVATVVSSAAAIQSSLLSLSSSFSSSSDSDSSARTANFLAPNHGGGNQQRKLSMVEEEESEEWSPRPAERRNSPACPAGPRAPTAGTPLLATMGSYGSKLISSQPKDLSMQTLSAEQPSHASANGSHNEDMKAYLIDPEQDKMAGQVTPCNADNVPAYYKPKSELQAEARAAAATKTSATKTSATKTSAAKARSFSGQYSDDLCELTSDASGSHALVPGSPPTTPRDDGLTPVATQSRLAKLRQNNLARKREQMKTMKMPELSEYAETSDCEQLVTAVNGIGPARASAVSGSNDDNDASDPPGEFEDGGGGGGGGGGGNHARDWVGPPSPAGDPVTPSLPEAFLKRLGLSTEGRALVNGDLGIEDVPDKLLLEKRFNSLSLAFKTDRLTLEKRLEIQERSRDLTEQNIDKELQGLRDATELLKQMCQDEHVQEVADKIQHHLEILEQSIARLSSRAEVLGAVQQEKRMCLAMDVMITFTENIRRLREKEQSEVEEARKVLNERQLTTSLSMDSYGLGDRRSASVCGPLNNAGRTNRRRSDVAIPKIFGGSGAHLHLNSSMDAGYLSELSKATNGCGNGGDNQRQEPRQRFQSATANVTVKNAVTSTLRRSSMERQRNLSLQSSTASSSSSTGLGPSANSSLDKSQDKDASSKQHCQEEEAYRHGYEEGLKASLGRELTELRDQQTHISGNLEQVMDRVETLQHEEQARDTELEEAMSKLKEATVKVRQWLSNPNWQTASHTLRRLAAGVIFLVALGVVVITFIPLVPGHVELRNHGRPAQ